MRQRLIGRSFPPRRGLIPGQAKRGRSASQKNLYADLITVPVPVRSQFRDCALASGLVKQADLEAAQAELPHCPTHSAASQRPAATSTVSNPSSNPAIAEPSEADKALAEALIRMGRLNSYQAEQLLAGKRKLNLGPYRILDSIGKGGMGEVYKAEHVIMGRIVAVKVLPKSKSTPEAIANFTREIRSQAKLDHGNLVRAFDAGAEGSVYFLVTEYIPGTDLRRYVRRPRTAEHE